MGGALSTALTVALFAVLALRPPLPRRSTPFSLQFAFSWWINELPVVGLWWLALGTAPVLLGAPTGVVWWVLLALSAFDVAALAWLLVRSGSARPALAAALRAEYGPRGGPTWTPPPWWRIVLMPFLWWRPDVRRIRNRRYGPAGRSHLLDVYVPRRERTARGPVLVYFHGGGFVMGSKVLGAGPLLHRLAADGWVCVSASYRLGGATYADRLDDTRAVLGWVRAHAEELGADPDKIFLSGGSAGAHLAATAALTGAEVRGVVPMYGYYGQVDRSLPGGTSPADHVRASAPPFLVLHGALDTLVRREDAREFSRRISAVSCQPVVHVELPGANHSFDCFPSLRFSAVCDAVARFAELVLEGDSPTAQTTARAGRRG